LKKRVARLENAVQVIQMTMNSKSPVKISKQIAEGNSPSGDEANSPLSDGPSLSDNMAAELCDMDISLRGSLLDNLDHASPLNLVSILQIPILDVQIRNAMVSVLPKGESLSRALDANNQMWMELQYLSPGHVPKYPTFREFAAHAISNGSMFDVAEVAQTLAFADGTAKEAIRLIDRWIISDERYLSTLDGLRRAVVQARLVLAHGNLNLSWQISRSNMAQGQIQGLHRNRLSLDAIRMWWAMYFTDRQLSLMLGRPYGIQEKHCALPPGVRAGEPLGPTWTFADIMMQAARISGKIIDHVQVAELEDASHGIVRLEQELGLLVSKIPDDDSASERFQDSQIGPSRSVWKEKHMSLLLICQCYLSLYIPYLAESVQNSEYAYVQDRCIQNARNFLYHYRLFHQPPQKLTHNYREYDDSAIAAVVLIVLALPRLDKVGDVNEQMQDAVDLELIRVTMDILGGHEALFSAETSTLYSSLQRFVETCNNSLDPIWLSLQLPSLTYLEFSGAKSISEFIQVAKAIFA
jgi:hypothetical protein